jgi:hypothetical protein
MPVTLDGARQTHVHGWISADALRRELDDEFRPLSAVVGAAVFPGLMGRRPLGLDRHFCLARSEHEIVDPVVQNDLLALGLVHCVQQGEGLFVFLSKHTHRFAVRGVRSL